MFNKLKKFLKSKGAVGSVATAIKVGTACVLGAAVLVGGVALINDVVLPNTSDKVQNVAEYEDGEGGSTGGVTPVSVPVIQITDGDSEGLHYHNDELFTGTCDDTGFLYNNGKIESRIFFWFNGGEGENDSIMKGFFSQDYTTALSPTINYTNISPTRPGYVLAGWSVGTADYINATDIPRTLGDNVNAYAIWNPVVSTITFTIDSTEYTADSGMTWDEWCSSAYNTGDYYCENGQVWQSWSASLYLTGNIVNSSDVILANQTYEIMFYGSGD